MGFGLLDKVGTASELAFLFETEFGCVALYLEQSSPVLVWQVCNALYSLEQTFLWNTFFGIKDKFKCIVFSFSTVRLMFWKLEAY